MCKNLTQFWKLEYYKQLFLLYVKFKYIQIFRALIDEVLMCFFLR